MGEEDIVSNRHKCGSRPSAFFKIFATVSANLVCLQAPQRGKHKRKHRELLKVLVPYRSFPMWGLEGL